MVRTCIEVFNWQFGCIITIDQLGYVDPTLRVKYDLTSWLATGWHSIVWSTILSFSRVVISRWSGNWWLRLIQGLACGFGKLFTPLLCRCWFAIALCVRLEVLPVKAFFSHQVRFTWLFKRKYSSRLNAIVVWAFIILYFSSSVEIFMVNMLSVTGWWFSWF